MVKPFSKWVGNIMLIPVYVYRYTFSSFMGRQCRHLPTCSQYAIDAVKLNGPWRGFWLMVSRVYRCGPRGSHGFDPAPDIRHISHPIWAPWRYGAWGKTSCKEHHIDCNKNEGH